jgi:hypothetical protein
MLIDNQELGRWLLVREEVRPKPRNTLQLNASKRQKAFQASIRSSQYYTILYNRFYPQTQVRTLPTPENSARRYRVLQDLAGLPPLQSDTFSEDNSDETPPLHPVSLRHLSAMASNHAQRPVSLSQSAPKGSVNDAASHISISDSDDEAENEAPRYGPPVLIVVWTEVCLTYCWLLYAHRFTPCL